MANPVCHCQAVPLSCGEATRITVMLNFAVVAPPTLSHVGLDSPWQVPITMFTTIPTFPLHRRSPQGSANRVPGCHQWYSRFQTPQVVRAQVSAGFSSSLAKLQPHLRKPLLENLGRSVINLQLVGGERRVLTSALMLAGSVCTLAWFMCYKL